MKPQFEQAYASDLLELAKLTAKSNNSHELSAATTTTDADEPPKKRV